MVDYGKCITSNLYFKQMYISNKYSFFSEWSRSKYINDVA